MADDGSQQSNVWPLPKFSFQVTWDSQVAVFQEVSGLDMEVKVIEYRSGDNPAISTIKMPGIKKYGNITMKKVFLNLITSSGTGLISRVGWVTCCPRV